MRIVILGPAHPFRGGGITTFNERMARALQEAGHEVTIVNFTVQYPGFLFPGKSQLTDEPAPTDILIERRLHSMNPISWFRTGLYLRRSRPDLIIVRFWLPLMGPAFGTVLRIARGNRHTKITAITDNIRPHEKRPGDKIFTRYFLKSCDRFVCMSSKVREDLLAFGLPQPVLQVEHPLYDNFGAAAGREEARQRLGLAPEDKVMLFFGFIRQYKGLDLLLEAMTLLEDPWLKLVVAGEFYEDEALYRPLMDPLISSGKLLLHQNFIPNDAVKYYFSAADVVVQPYRNATQSGVTPLAYHFEKPMIVTRVGGLPDYVKDGETGLVTAAEPAAIADAITRFFTLGESHFISQIRTEKKRFSWQVFCESLLRFNR
ncbi:glycosyltransferase [Flavihumibacter petaseus]|uniref:Putative glycosyltransferase n=1 Tax=Flavihumibacter petaseus NBRC 106054 TaxID=1220578 RepID=A0A0E9N6F8_9BACT|nr:glycosyltransferase [Flavihumibacter petaseus]GAO45311.1 putative glycosyltransferase [Flavihumibacter petaseus NBRC 106054]